MWMVSQVWMQHLASFMTAQRYPVQLKYNWPLNWAKILWFILFGLYLLKALLLSNYNWFCPNNASGWTPLPSSLSLSLQMAQSSTRGLYQQQQAGDPDKQLCCKGTMTENKVFWVEKIERRWDVRIQKRRECKVSRVGPYWKNTFTNLKNKDTTWIVEMTYDNEKTWSAGVTTG